MRIRFLTLSYSCLSAVGGNEDNNPCDNARQQGLLSPRHPLEKPASELLKQQ